MCFHNLPALLSSKPLEFLLYHIFSQDIKFVIHFFNSARLFYNRFLWKFQNWMYVTCWIQTFEDIFYRLKGIRKNIFIFFNSVQNSALLFFS